MRTVWRTARPPTQGGAFGRQIHHHDPRRAGPGGGVRRRRAAVRRPRRRRPVPGHRRRPAGRPALQGRGLAPPPRRRGRRSGFPPPCPPPAGGGGNGWGGDAAVLVHKKTKSPPETCVLTEKGLAWLLSQSSPRQVLEDFVRALESRQAEAAEMLAGVRRMQAGFDALKAGAEKVLEQLPRPGAAAAPAESLMDRFQRFHQQPADDAPALLLARLRRMAGVRRLGGLPAAGAVPPGADRLARPDGRRLPRRPAPPARGRTHLPAPLDRPAARPAGAAVRPARRPRDCVLRQPSPVTSGEPGRVSARRSTQ